MDNENHDGLEHTEQPQHGHLLQLTNALELTQWRDKTHDNQDALTMTSLDIEHSKRRFQDTNRHDQTSHSANETTEQQ